MDTVTVAMTLEQCWHRVPGGTAVAGIGMASALAERPEVNVVGVSARHRSPPENGFRPTVPMRSLPLPRSLLYEAWHRLRWPPIEMATGKVDVIHATAMAMPPVSAPVVMTIHDLAFLHYPKHFTPRGIAFFHRGLELARRDAAMVLCPSRTTRQDVVANGIADERVRVIPLGIDVGQPTGEDVERVRSAYRLHDRPYVLWVGTVEPRKNLRGLLRAFSLVDHPARLVLVGPTGWKEDLSRLVAPVADRVVRLGFVPAPDLAALYRGARAFCYPSLIEGFGFPVLEAMGQGTPVITSAGTSTEEIAGDAGVVVDPHDTSAIASAIRRVLDDDDLTAKLSAAGRRRASEYTWERTAHGLLDAYKEVT